MDRTAANRRKEGDGKWAREKKDTKKKLEREKEETKRGMGSRSIERTKREETRAHIHRERAMSTPYSRRT